MAELTTLNARAEEERLTEEILERTRQLARLRLDQERGFTPGKTAVKYAGRVYDEQEMENLVRASLEFWLTAGRWHRRLEKDLAEFYGLAHARLVNSGSSANLLATTALTSPLLGARRMQPGDEVITVAAGFPTTVAPLVQNGLVPVFIDVHLETGNVDVSQLEAARSSKTRAVALAHTLGNPFDLDAITAFCKQHNLWLHEDNCDASGSLYRGKKTGTFGDVATLSFYPPHHMTTGEGGAVLANTDEMNRALESIRDWGRDCWCQSGVDNTCKKRFEWQLGELPQGYDHKYTYSHLGYNLKMTDLQASIGVAQLQKLTGFGAARRANFRWFKEALADLSDVLILPEATPHSDPSWFGFLMTVREGAPFTRDGLVAHLEKKKIQTRMLFGGNLVRQPAFVQLAQDAKARGAPAPFRVAAPLTNTDVIMQRSFWIGVYPGLTEEMRAHVAGEIRAFARGTTKA
ncbi:MAG: lipopolysaccharide biosynthesis protein RfbH [Deltaproteobacteria bacterium]|nr:lipopolysaccharide biosynthesis protein RfbH [Deltaproteobacteria bacterium]